MTWLSSWQLEEACSLREWVLTVLEVKCKGSGLYLASHFQRVLKVCSKLFLDYKQVLIDL